MHDKISYLRAYGTFWKYYADFYSRTTNEVFWKAWFVHNFIITIFSFPLFFMYDIFLGFTAKNLIVFSMVWLIVFCVYAIATLIPTIAIILRRLHDINRHGCWILLFLLVPIAGMIIFYIMLSRKSAPFDVFPGRSESGPFSQQPPYAQQQPYTQPQDPYGQQPFGQPSPNDWQQNPYEQQQGPDSPQQPYNQQPYTQLQDPYGQQPFGQPSPNDWQQPYIQPPPYDWQQSVYAPPPSYAQPLPLPRRFSPQAGGDRATVAIILTIILVVVSYVFSFATLEKNQTALQNYIENSLKDLNLDPYGSNNPYDEYGGDYWNNEDNWGGYWDEGDGVQNDQGMSPAELDAIDYVKNSTLPGFPEFTIEEVLLSKVDEWGFVWNCTEEKYDGYSLFYVEALGTLEGTFNEVSACFEISADLTITITSLSDGTGDENNNDALALYEEWYSHILSGNTQAAVA